nr:MAG TPA: hypothetical protein [Microviridae sp.]
MPLILGAFLLPGILRETLKYSPIRCIIRAGSGVQRG